MGAIVIRTRYDKGTATESAEVATSASTLLYYLKQTTLEQRKLNILRKKIIKNIKIQLPAISMHLRLPQSLISMSMQKLYTNRSSFAQSARFSRPDASLSISPTLSRKDNSIHTPRYWFQILFSLSVVLKYKLQVQVY